MLVDGLVDLVDLVEDPSATTLPDGWLLDAGTYFIAPPTFQDVRMEMRFYFGRDYAVGATGDLVTDNLFLMSSYLIDPVAEVRIDDSGPIPTIEVDITHAGPGPLVELLGLGADPPNPIPVTDQTLLDAPAHLRDLLVETVIFFQDHPGVSTIEYDVQSPLMLADAFLIGAAMDLAMVSADGWRDDTEQDLDVDTWTIEYSDGVGALDGDITFTTRGGRFDYVSRLHYERSAWPEITLECAG